MPIPENNVRFTDLSNGTVKAGSIFATSEPDSSTPPSYDSTKVTAQEVGNFVATSQTYSGLSTTAKTLVAAINEAAQGGGGSSNVPDPTAAGKTIKSQSDGEGGYEWTETDYHPYNGWTTLQFIDGREVNIGFTNLYALSTNASNPVWGVVLLSNDDYQTVSDAIPVVLTGSFNQTYRGYTDHTVYFVGAKEGKLYTVYLTDSTSHPSTKCDVEVEITDIPSYTEVSGTLTAGSTSITLSDAAITSSSTIDIYTDTYGVNPTAVTVSTGSVTMTFESQANNVSVKVRIS